MKVFEIQWRRLHQLGTYPLTPMSIAVIRINIEPTFSLEVDLRNFAAIYNLKCVTEQA